MKSQITEGQVLRFSKCNLLDWADPEPEYLAAYQTFKWVLLRISDNKPLTKNLLTSKFEENYKPFFEVKDGIKYWNGIRMGRRFISKTLRLLMKYDVLQPIQSYKYQSVIGEYAVIQKKTKTEKPLVLALSYNRPLYYSYPDVSSQIKWLHSKTTYRDIGIYNFALFRGDDWKFTNLNESLINLWLNGILSQISSEKYYINPGSHCLNCKSKGCLVGINGSNDSSR